MSSHNEQIQPSAFDVASPAPAQQAASTGVEAPPAKPSWVIPGLLGLALLAVLVVFWLPGRIGPAEIEPLRIPEPAASLPSAQKQSAEEPPEAGNET